MNDHDFIKNLPAKRMACGVIFFNESGEVLIVKPSYKDYWSVPGGVIEKDESPRQAALREVKEEVGLDAKQMDFVCVDYMSPEFSGYSTKDENMQFIFYGGVLSKDDIEKIKLPPEEISECKFVSKEEAIRVVSGNLGKRLTPCFNAIQKGKSIYLEAGKEIIY